MNRERVWHRSEREIVRLSHAGLDSSTLRREVVQQLRRIVPVDAFFCATVDPDTLLFTGSFVEEIPEYATLAFLANEFLQDDVMKFTQLAQGAQPVQGLYEATRGDPGSSPRYRDILAPLGLGDELRAALRVGATTWGVLCLHRDAAGPGFTHAEACFLERIAPHLAEGLRTSLLLEAGNATSFEGPGLLVLADDFTIASTTASADYWLDELSDWPRRSEPPQAIRAVAARLEELERGGRGGHGLLPRSRVQTRSGRWLLLHAARFSGGEQDGADRGDA